MHTAALDQYEADEERQDKEWSARLERAKGYVNMGDFELVEAVQSLYDRHRSTSRMMTLPETEYVRLEKAIATDDLCEAGRLLREAVIEQKARELEDE